MKRTMYAVLFIAALLLFAGCGEDGNGGGASDGSGGGGGGSYNSGTEQSNTAGANAGEGKVVIELL